MKSKFQINKELIILSVCSLFTINSFAQDYQSNVCTPKGNSVVAFIMEESLENTRAYYDSVYALNYPNAIQIPTYDGYSSTRKFNCHGYAWHISDGGSDRWIGYGYPYDNDPEYGYWQDASYIEVAQRTYPGKVNWSSGDHSAITTENPDILISKWNEYPLMKHEWDDSPYGTSNLKYYKLNFSISGPDLVCNSNTTFTLSPTPGGATNWTKSSNLSFIGDDSGTSVIVKTVSSSTSGNGGLYANFTSGCGTSFVVNKTVWAGVPAINEISGPEYTPNYQWATYYAQPNNAQMAATNYEWILNPLNGNSVYDYGWTADIAFYNSGYYQVVTRAQNTCGWSSYAVLGVEVYDSKSLSFSPNPSSGETTITIESTNKKELLVSEWDFEIYTQTQVLKAKKNRLKGNSTVINTAGWKEGVYVVRVLYNNEVITGKLIVKR